MKYFELIKKKNLTNSKSESAGGPSKINEETLKDSG